MNARFVPVMLEQPIALPVDAAALSAPLSDHATWIRMRVYGSLVTHYLVQGMPLDRAIALATNQAVHAAFNFDHHFGGQTIDVPPASKPREPPRARQAAPGPASRHYPQGAPPVVRPAEPRRRPEVVLAEQRGEAQPEQRDGATNESERP